MRKTVEPTTNEALWELMDPQSRVRVRVIESDGMLGREQAGLSASDRFQTSVTVSCHRVISCRMYMTSPGLDRASS